MANETLRPDTLDTEFSAADLADLVSGVLGVNLYDAATGSCSSGGGGGGNGGACSGGTGGCNGGSCSGCTGGGSGRG